jgi:type I restriction enzyme S subunit
VLDSQRKPLNADERRSMKGGFPYWGANNIVDHINQFIFDEPLILMAEDGGNFHEAAERPICNLIDGKCWVNNHAHVLRAKPGFSREFIFYYFAHRDITPYINGGTRTKLNQGDLVQLPLITPPLDEQRRIAAVLTSVDDAIQAAQAVVEQARLARDAVLDGLLAGDQWLRATFGTLVRVGSGYAFKANDFTDAATDIPVVRMSNLKVGRLDLSEAKRFPPDLLHGLDAFQLKAGDFVFGMSGSLTNHAWVTASDLPCYQNQRVGRLLPKNGTHPRFAAYLYLSDHVQQGIIQLAAGAAQLNISASQIESIVVPCPPPEVQARIAAILTDLDSAIAQDQQHLDGLRITKRGLLDDLLTGRVRVPATALSEASHAP